MRVKIIILFSFISIAFSTNEENKMIMPDKSQIADHIGFS